MAFLFLPPFLLPSTPYLHHRPMFPLLPNLSFHQTPPKSHLFLHPIHSPIRSKIPTLAPKVAPFSSSTLQDTGDFSFNELEEEVELDSEWEGAVVYRRDASVTHLEYTTTLERLGLGKLSTELSRSRASEMGIRIIPRRGVVDPLLVGGTPVLVSVDVTRRKRKLMLDGIVRTVITLGCNRCAEPVAQSIFSNFTLLLTEEPREEPDEINMGVIFGEDKSKATGSGFKEDEDESLVDLDDRLYFPAQENELDISKQIRDIVHVEITINSVCAPSCKGLCLQCGTNLNKSSCGCRSEEAHGTGYGPLKNLRKQMQRG